MLVKLHAFTRRSRVTQPFTSMPEAGSWGLRLRQIGTTGVWTGSITEVITFKKRFSCSLVIKALDMNKSPPRKVKRRDASKHQWLRQLGKYEIIAIEFLCIEGEALTNNNTYWQRNRADKDKRNHNYNGHRKLCTNLIYNIAHHSLNVQKRLNLLPNAFSLVEAST